MAQTGEFAKETLFLGVLASGESLLGEALSALAGLYGPIRERSGVAPFTFTDYYNEEMGGIPLRSYYTFEEAVDPSRLAEIKVATNDLERRFSVEGRRRVNLDPGLFTLSNLVLATTKNRSHRIALDRGIYAELTLIYHDHSYRALPWTYADYKSRETIMLLNSWRSALKQGGN
ncbi:MAG: DUF4416 family protein [Spirochaetales bacterium]|nr:DUF4416 family protein [Spirochaetales bacterium]